MITKIKEISKLVFLGPNNSYSHKAASSLFGENINYELVDDFDSIIASIIEDRAEKGIIPFFNPYEEHIRECQEKLFETNLIATAATKVDVELNLASNRLDLAQIQRVRSNRHVFKQCDIWLQKNLPEVIREISSSTSRAAEEVKILPGTAAICSLEAAAKNALKVVAEGIQNPKNFTLFFLIQKRDSVKEWGEYSFFCFKLNNPSEKMYILDILQRHHLRSSQKWDFPHLTEKHSLFFLEFFGSYRDLNSVAFEAECSKYFQEFKLLGSFDQSITKLLEKI